MTVEEMIDELSKCDPKSIVYSEQQYDEKLMVIEVCQDKSRNLVLICSCALS